MSDHAEHSHGHSAAVDNPAAHVDSPASLYLVFALLLGGVFLTIACSMSGLGDKAIYAHMTISAVQASLVGYIFMHLKRSDTLTWLVAFSGLFIMGILFSLPLGDYLTRQLGGL